MIRILTSSLAISLTVTVMATFLRAANKPRAGRKTEGPFENILASAVLIAACAGSAAAH